MNTVGYGDMAPQNDTEKLFCIFFIYVACGIFAYTLNVVGNIIQQISKNKIKFLNNIMIINEFMNKKNINFDLRMRIRKYLEYVWMEEQYRNSEEENVIIDKLSNTLKEELLLETTGKILRQIPFFNNNFSEETLTKIVFKMKELHFMPGDKIFQKGDKLENSLYILLKGDVELYLDVVKKNESHQLIQKIEKGKIFGEKKFITGSEREVSARSSSFSTVYVLEFNDFLSVINGNFEDYAKFSEIKDNIHLYNDYKDVKICCSFCQDSNHTIITCAQMHLKVFKPRVIQKYLYHKPNERMQIIRRNKKTSNARKKQKLYRFIAKTIQKEHLFTEEDISDINALPSSERNSSENEEKISKLSEEYNESSEEGSIDQTKVINSNNPSTFRENTSKTSKPSKLNENKTSENKLLNPSENLARIASDDHLIKYSFDLMKNNSKLGLSMNKNISSNSIKIISGTNHANKENIEKKANIVDIVCFERKMDYENYFPLNNSENVINSYNKAQRTMKNNSDINKLTRRKTRTKFFRSKTHKKFSGLIKNPSCVNSKNIDLRKQNSPKKSGFFSKFDENQIKVDIMDRKAIIKLLENKKKEKEKSLLKKTFSWFRGLLKEGNN